MRDQTWGIIRYSPGRGAPENDIACFDGWYASEELARPVFEMWTQRYQGWIVALVVQKDAHWGNRA